MVIACRVISRSSMRSAVELPVAMASGLTGSSSQANSLVSSGDWELVDVPFADLCPGNAALQSLMAQYR